VDSSHEWVRHWPWIVDVQLEILALPRPGEVRPGAAALRAAVPRASYQVAPEFWTAIRGLECSESASSEYDPLVVPCCLVGSATTQPQGSWLATAGAVNIIRRCL
jgi:hypothetical protein